MVEKTVTIPDSILKAENMTYDNTNSGLTASDVQTAIDEINSKAGSAGQGDENTIESISINGIAVTPDANKNVEITIPDIPSTDDLATIDYVNRTVENLIDGESVTAGYRDSVIIPDKYNTGCSGELIAMADFFGDYYTEGSALYITTALQSDLGTVYENLDIVDCISLNKTGLSSMTFKNCRFSVVSSYAVLTGTNFETNDIEVIFENCEFLNQTSASVEPSPKIKMINCKIHDMGSDGGKVFDQGSYENCYFYNIGTIEDAHADGIQVTTANNNFSIVNCRFDMPSYTGYTSNAAIFFILEEDSYDSTVKDCIMTGGNYTMYYGRKYPDAETPVVLENNTVENIIVGCSYQYGILNDNSDSFNHDEVVSAEKLFVSSVYQEDDKIKLLVTNYTNEEKTLDVITDKGEVSVTIPACPLYDEGLAYTAITDFPFDIEVEVEGNYAICYDDGEQIRFANFTGGDVILGGFANYCTIDEVTDLIADNSGQAFSENYRFKYVPGTIYRGSLYSHTQKQMRETGTNYVGLEYILDGTETHIRFTGATSGATDRVAWCFVDSDNEVIDKAEFVKNETYENVVIEIPSGASKVYINGNNKRAAHLEVRVSDLLADKGWTNQLLSAFGKRISYKDTFAWKEMPTGYFAFTFDDSLDDIADVVDLFEELGVPCCFGCIPERLNEGISSTETVGEVMLRAISNGGEVLAHGDGGGIVTAANIDDENHLFNKFVCNMQKFYDYGINVRGVLRVGGTDDDGNEDICNDERTDKWVRLFYDYGDLYGISEPYNHARVGMKSTSEEMKAQVDEIINAKEFCSFIFHSATNLHDLITEAVQYIQEQGGVICTYAYVYDTFGSTTEEVRLEDMADTISGIGDMSSHVEDTEVHITSAERANWDDANSKKHEHSNSTVLDNTTASYTTEEQEKLSSIAEDADAVSFTQKLTSGTEVGTININGTDTVLYAPTNTDTVTTATTTGSGNAVTGITASNGALTVTKGSTFLTEHPDISTSDDTTSTATPAHGGTVTMVDSVTRDDNGHVTAVNTKTITLPSDTKVTNTLATGTKAYLTGTTSSSTNTGTLVFDTGVYLGTDSGQLELVNSGNSIELNADPSPDGASGGYGANIYINARSYSYGTMLRMSNTGSGPGMGGISITTGSSTHNHGISITHPSSNSYSISAQDGKSYIASIYSDSSTITTSDREKKTDIEDISEKYEELFFKLQPRLFKFKEGTSGRIHIGAIAQEVEEALNEVGISDTDFAGFIRQEKDYVVNEETGEITQEEGYDYYLRYEEFIMLLCHMLQKMYSKYDALEARLAALEEKIN